MMLQYSQIFKKYKPVKDQILVTALSNDYGHEKLNAIVMTFSQFKLFINPY